MAINIFGKKEEAKPDSAVLNAPNMPSVPSAPSQEERSNGLFYIDLRSQLVKLPDIKDYKKLDVRYPLILPYAYAHIYWDEKEQSVIYKVEEPELDDVEKELLSLIQLGLEEMINISFIRAAKTNMIIEYLEKNVQAVLIQFGTKVSKETYNKIMYYVYRNSIGLNEIEPLLNDSYIEDIECNGANFPLYITHRKFENLRTNIIFADSQKLTEFVEKIAQKCGRYVSYAKPLLDGSLPDGSRVNATYSEDITTRGPTFTIRKFTKEPLTPIHLINFGTASPEIFAYLWTAIQHKNNIMIIGETSSGKTTFLNSIAYFIPPEARICSIEDTRELNLMHDNWLPSVTRSGFGIPTMLGKTYGEITLFDLLTETFRQNPDYVILGETRGKETYVLFQGMASGHPSLCTFHAGSVETLVRRLETPPISLPPSLVESLDIVCVITHIKTLEESKRRIKEINEIRRVQQQLGVVESAMPYVWEPIKDAFTAKETGASIMLQKISANTGIPVKELQNEIKKRAEILRKMAQRGITDFKEVNRIINAYYKDSEKVLREFGI